MSHQSIEPCPFCGSAAHEAVAPCGFIVECESCMARTDYRDTRESVLNSWNTRAIASVKREPLSDEQIDQIHGHAYIALRAQGFNGGMGGLTWDRASARAIEQAHGIGAPIKDSLTTDRGENSK